MKKFLLLGLIFCITSCGFHPRGQVALPADMERVFIKTNDPYGWLTRSIADYLKASGTYIAESSAGAIMTIEILHLDKTQQLLSVSGTQQTRQYNLILSATFQLLNSKGETVVGPQTVTEIRVLTVAANQILGGSNEADNLYEQMHQPLVYDIISRVASNDITHLMGQKKNP